MILTYKDIDYEKIWQDSLKCRKGYAKERAFNDNVEREFWKGLSRIYDNQPTLYDYSKEVYNFVKSLIDTNKSLIEIGPGTGKFTIPLSEKCSDITAIDFSRHMLNVLMEKSKILGINNILPIEGKWEDVAINETDYILSVNSLYRIFDIKAALKKMNIVAKEKVIIVRTIQKPIFNNLYLKLGLEDKTCLDYIYLPNILHSLNICADIKYMNVQYEIEFNNRESIYYKIKEEIGYIPNENIIEDYINENFKRSNKKYIFLHKTKVEIIYWETTKN
ncbi:MULTISPECIES: class I SAM-dependent methyltransferase [Clostridium]|uniref:Methyltransferase domain-containing protein n=1 Tax=Clostridium cadaveris TaxID=1529 RepID=A0A1I2J5P7_9CLOT|nr:class I SAM-dependent methyltransferase [Clostridium cadaveris]MDU4951458.1 class I SAM-dependent methyltransferase [Clostridium sp.]MDY4948070.1 class I SAM-dependent methyltransferase [Clostridium cadaveris]NME63185.1 class I SAM-dependent methyltransferase [Clostridium cadaveris]NWK10277.1 class I SAM-dependent methyltransferase [Clostridium cadaveris]UFH63474.1 class I SAM-dependent methyltransferase [Clostridium cadaveris]